MDGKYFVGWGCLALINACLAQIKTHLHEKETGEESWGGFAWWFISLFIGPLATFFILVFKDPINW